jgi:hypothetical protein
VTRLAAVNWGWQTCGRHHGIWTAQFVQNETSERRHPDDGAYRIDG